MDFTAEYGLIFGSYGFYCQIWIENPSGCKLDMEAERGIIHDISHLVKYARKLQELRHSSEICEKTVQYTENHFLNVQQMHKLLKFMLLYVRPRSYNLTTMATMVGGT